MSAYYNEGIQVIVGNGQNFPGTPRVSLIPFIQRAYDKGLLNFTTLPPGAIDFTEIQNIATNKLLGRSTAGSGVIEELTIGTGLSLSGGTLSNTATASPPAGSDGYIQYNNSGAFGASSNLFWDKTNNRLGIGSSSPLTKLNVVETITTSPRGILSSQYSTSTDGARIGFLKARGTEASPTTVATGDVLGRMMFRCYDGSSVLEMASIEAGVSGTVASTRVPTYLSFSTATNAAPSVLTERMRILNNGNVGIGTSSPSVSLESTGTIKGINVVATSNIDFENILYGTKFWSQNDGKTFIGDQSVPSAMLQVKGSGSTSATTSLLVQNSSGTEAFRIKDNQDARFNGTVALKGYTVATLPAGTVGMNAYVTDALAPTYLTTVVGGGAVNCPVFFDGTNWVAH